MDGWLRVAGCWLLEHGGWQMKARHFRGGQEAKAEGREFIIIRRQASLGFTSLLFAGASTTWPGADEVSPEVDNMDSVDTVGRTAGFKAQGRSNCQRARGPLVAGCQGWPTAKAPPRRREISMGTWKTVIRRQNKNSGGAKILFFAKSGFWTASGAAKRGATGASRAR